MNTLNHEQTARILGNPQIYSALRKQWSAVVNSEQKHELTAAHHLIYLALLGKDWRKAFTPITNRRKLQNGAYYNWELHNALHALKFAPPESLLAPFGNLVSPSILPILRQLLPTFNYTIDLGPGDFAGSIWPFDAYSAPVTTTTLTETAHA